MTPLQTTIAWLLMHRPYYGSLAAQLLTWHEDETLPYPAATDGTKVVVQPAMFNDRPLEQRGFIAAHEVEHCVREHCAELRRCKERGLGPDGKEFSNEKANIAMDVLINETLVTDGMTCPEDGMRAATFKLNVNPEMTWRDVYLLLPDSPSGKGKGKGFDGHDPAPGPTSEAAARKQQVMRAVASAVEAAKRAGKVPAHVQRTLDSLADPPPSFKELLLQFCTAHGRGEDWSYRRPRRARLVLPPNLILPTQCRPSAGTVVVGIDVSGSIDPHTLTYFAGCLSTTLAECAFEELWLATVECDVTGARQIQSIDELEAFFRDVRGGGGTHMPSLYEWIDREGIRPTQAIFLTDGYTDFGKQPDYPVGWCMTTDVKPPYGACLRVNV